MIHSKLKSDTKHNAVSMAIVPNLVFSENIARNNWYIKFNPGEVRSVRPYGPERRQKCSISG